MAEHIENPLLVVAIDFGTTYSGYAFQFKHNYSREDPTNKISAPQTWNEGKIKVVSMKTPTCLLLDKNRNIDSFGYEVCKMKKINLDKLVCHVFFIYLLVMWRHTLHLQH